MGIFELFHLGKKKSAETMPATSLDVSSAEAQTARTSTMKDNLSALSQNAEPAHSETAINPQMPAETKGPDVISQIPPIDASPAAGLPQTPAESTTPNVEMPEKKAA